MRLLVPVAVLLAAVFDMSVHPAEAAEPMTGEIFGQVKDVTTGAPVEGALVIATSPSLMGEQVEVTDASGFYRLTRLPPGVYAIAVSAAGFKDDRLEGVELFARREVRVQLQLLPSTLVGREIVVERPQRSVIDVGSPATGITVDRETMDLALPKYSIDIFDVAPGTTRDRRDASAIGGGASNETSFTLDGVALNDFEVGGPAILLPTRFLEQVDVKIGGFLPEDPSTTGGNVSYVSRIGGNELHGSVFTYATPYRARAKERGVRGGGDTITVNLEQPYAQMLGFEVGGPIVRDALWFHVGAAPLFYLEEMNRTVNRRVDRDGDGQPDVDEATDSYLYEPIPGGRRRFGMFSIEVPYTAKLTYGPSASHRLTLGVVGSGFYTGDRYDEGLLNGGPLGYPNGASSNDSLTSLGYDGKLLDGRLLLNTSLAYRRYGDHFYPKDGTSDRSVFLHDGEHDLVSFEPEWAEGCGAPLVDPEGLAALRCPVYGYNTGGFWGSGRGLLDMLEARAELTGVFDLAGRHRTKAGTRLQWFSKDFRFSRTGPEGREALVVLLDNDTPDPADDLYNVFRFAERGSDLDAPVYADFHDTARSRVSSFFLQDSWMIRDRVTLVGGARLDLQALGAGPTTIHFTNVSPRGGVILDVLGDGRSKVSASYARNFQILPFSAAWSLNPQPGVFTVHVRCNDDDPLSCPELRDERDVFAPAPVAPAPGLAAGYVDTIQLGAEHQLLDSLVAGLVYTHSVLGRGLDDVATDGFDGFRLANPGEGDDASFTVFDEILGEEVVYPIPKASRRYDALTLHATKTLAGGLVGSASYTLAFLRGNFPGGGDNERDAFQPAALPEFDAPEGLQNGTGWLPQDQRHQVKVDAAYVWDVRPRLRLIPSGSVRFFSGTPRNYYAARAPFESELFLLPRGSAGRTDAVFELSGGLGAELALTGGTRLRVGLAVKNLLDLQPVTGRDPLYVAPFEPSRPILGGDERDLRHVKDTRGRPPRLNAGFGAPTAQNFPRELRLELQLSF